MIKKNPEHLGCPYIIIDSLLILTITMPMSFLATFSYKYKETLNFILSSHYY